MSDAERQEKHDVEQYTISKVLLPQLNLPKMAIKSFITTANIMWSSTSLYEKHDVEQYLCMRKICKVI
jgi:hypothetical protein